MPFEITITLMGVYFVVNPFQNHSSSSNNILMAYIHQNKSFIVWNLMPCILFHFFLHSWSYRALYGLMGITTYSYVIRETWVGFSPGFYGLFSFFPQEETKNEKRLVNMQDPPQGFRFSPIILVSRWILLQSPSGNFIEKGPTGNGVANGGWANQSVQVCARTSGLAHRTCATR